MTGGLAGPEACFRSVWSVFWQHVNAHCGGISHLDCNIEYSGIHADDWQELRTPLYSGAWYGVDSFLAAQGRI